MGNILSPNSHRDICADTIIHKKDYKDIRETTIYTK